MESETAENTIVGVGMVTCDHIYRDGRLLFDCVGGTCGNVMSYAAAFSHKCYLVSRIGNDYAGKFILREMLRLGIRTDFLFPDSRGTPCVVAQISTAHYPPRHKYEFQHPETGEHFSRFQPPTLKHAHTVCDAVRRPRLFYCDRVTDSTVAMALRYAARGVAVMVEPSDTASTRRLGELAGAITVLKASDEHLRLEGREWRETGAAVRILTLGGDGVAFGMSDCTTITEHSPSQGWDFLRPTSGTPIVDTIGAGDAFSGALIGYLLSDDQTALKWNQSRVRQAVHFAQEIAQRSCLSAGPRSLLDDSLSWFSDLKQRALL